MLQDTTNVIKTFLRRQGANKEVKQSLVAPPASIVQQSDVPKAQKQRAAKNGRRTSVIPIPKKAPVRQARGKKGDAVKEPKSAEERSAEIVILMRQQLAILKQEYAEIDDYELIEESPEKPKAKSDPSPVLARSYRLGLIAEEEDEEEEEQEKELVNEAESSPALALASPLPSAPQPPLLDLSASDQSPNGPMDLPSASPAPSISTSIESSKRTGGDSVSHSDEISSGPSLSSSDSSQPLTAITKSPSSDISSSVRSLLDVCRQAASKLSDLPVMSELLARLGDTSKVQKVGEGSYGEAFKVGSHVLKVIPVDGACCVNGWPQKKADEMTGEVLVALTLSGLSLDKKAPNVSPCFVETSQAAVVRGPYDGHLVRAWHMWDEENNSENEAVDAIGLGSPDANSSSSTTTNQDATDQQLYLILAMGDAGQDLEKYELGSRAGMAAKVGKAKSFPLQSQLDEAKSILAQTAFALAIGEAAVEFEHRDLHWGNLLIKQCAEESLNMRIGGMDVKVKSHGVRASLIDFTASRLVTQGQGKVAFCDLEGEEGIFEGPEGEIQFDTYRAMRELTGKKWAESCLGTNCLWLAYLAETLAAEKIVGSSAEASKSRKQLRDFKTRCMGYSAAGELAIKDPLFVGMWSA